jgi:aldose 1-epimerase
MAEQIITLRDAESGATARIAPRVGFNCFAFQAVVEGRPVDVLWAKEDFVENPVRPSGSGIPLLFPFPGRIRGTSFGWLGKTYQLEEGDQRGNAIHGFVYTRPWRVIEQSASRAVGQFQASLDEPSLLDRWPADFRITAEYELTANQLSLTITVENPGETALPFGFGAHPYFRTPLGGDNAAACQIQVPVSTHWPLSNMIPTGECFASEQADQLRAGLTLGETKFDDVYGGLEREGDQYEAKVMDPVGGRQLRMTFDDANVACVVFTPPHREAVCIEPYTCLPDPVFLTSRGVESGLRVLEPGDRFVTRLQIRLEPISPNN